MSMITSNHIYLALKMVNIISDLLKYLIIISSTKSH